MFQKIKPFVIFFIKIREVKGASISFGTTLDCVIPAWSAGIQADMDVSGRILRT
jgi:hypothetical protein